MPRSSGRAPDALREVRFDRNFVGAAAGSCLVASGRTRVICTAAVEDGVPPWLKGSGRGWLTAEYAMLPASTPVRKPRDGRKGPGVDGRSQEIQRLVGRALRTTVDLSLLGERTIWLDCDVVEADGGTRCASINGAYVALADAIRGLRKSGALAKDPLRSAVAAVSIGLVRGELLLDLDYSEDSEADADMTVVMTDEGRFVEVQASAERRTFSREQMSAALDGAASGVREILRRQAAALAGG